LLDLELTAFFASRQCSGTAIRVAMDWALHQARAKRAVVSGFHSPLEQSVLKVLIAANSPAVVVLARSVQGAKLPPEWSALLEKGNLAVVSGLVTTSRLTQQLATERNALVVQLAERIVVAHVSPAGSLAAQVEHWHHEGRQVDVLTAG
jgi:predicted Rossmann fold nucleotide-binding protein DprA/Smf involved in DNA uptake